MKLNDVEGAYHCPLCNKPSVQDVGCDNCMEWYHLKCLWSVPNQGTKEFVIKVISSCALIYVSMILLLH